MRKIDHEMTDAIHRDRRLSADSQEYLRGLGVISRGEALTIAGYRALSGAALRLAAHFAFQASRKAREAEKRSKWASGLFPQ